MSHMYFSFWRIKETHFQVKGGVVHTWYLNFQKRAAKIKEKHKRRCYVRTDLYSTMGSIETNDSIHTPNICIFKNRVERSKKNSDLTREWTLIMNDIPFLAPKIHD